MGFDVLSGDAATGKIYLQSHARISVSGGADENTFTGSANLEDAKQSTLQIDKEVLETFLNEDGDVSEGPGKGYMQLASGGVLDFASQEVDLASYSRQAAVQQAGISLYQAQAW